MWYGERNMSRSRPILSNNVISKNLQGKAKSCDNWVAWSCLLRIISMNLLYELASALIESLLSISRILSLRNYILFFSTYFLYLRSFFLFWLSLLLIIECTYLVLPIFTMQCLHLSLRVLDHSPDFPLMRFCFTIFSSTEPWLFFLSNFGPLRCVIEGFAI